MPDSFDLNNIPRAADAVPAIPTSASEVAVRTMASDLELMGQSGGMMGQSAPQGMQVPVTLHPDATPNVLGGPDAGSLPALTRSTTETPTSSSGRGKIILITIAVIVGALALFALGYFVIGK